MKTKQPKVTVKELYKGWKGWVQARWKRGRSLPAFPQRHQCSAQDSIKGSADDKIDVCHIENANRPPETPPLGMQHAKLNLFARTNLPHSSLGGNHLAGGTEEEFSAALLAEQTPPFFSKRAEVVDSPFPVNSPSNSNVPQINDCRTVYSSQTIGSNYGTIIQNSGEHSNSLDCLAQKLKISRKADYGYYPTRTEEGLRRGGCTPGTRVGSIGGIVGWGNDTSPNCQPIFWLSGQGGAGKTAIAFTATKYFQCDASHEAMLGGSFFCSRHSAETRTASAIVRTIAYGLAVECPAFRMALKTHGDFRKVDHDPLSQFEALIVKPWKQCLPQRVAGNEPCFIISIDAIDELDPPGGTEFVEALVKVVKEHDLSGLKFLVTSRLEPALVERIEAFKDKRVFRLEKVPVKKSNADIKLYLQENLDKSIIEEEALVNQVVTESAGLFIYAATVVDYLKGRSAAQQKERLARLLALSPGSSHIRGATARLDNLYRHILETSLVDPRDQEDTAIRDQCLAILHTFLCTNERASTSVAVELLNRATNDNIDTAEADELVRRLHAVLYIQDGQVLWFHKSFPDFIFSQERSKSFHCRQDEHHRLLVNGSFGIMQQELRFNIADISTSYQLDRDNVALSNTISTNISAPLSYACRSWSGHLAATPLELSGSLRETLSDFLQLKILFWIEAMNLLGHRGLCAAMLGAAQNWVAQLEDPVSLLGDLSDAAAFAFHFSSNGAALSTPHLYISSLATFPRRSGLPTSWRQRFGRIPAFTNAHSTVGGGLALSMMVGSVAFVVLAVSPDGTQVAMGLSSGVIRTRGLASGEQLSDLKGHTGDVNSVVYSPDSKSVASGSDDKSVRSWDVLMGRQLKVFEGHAGAVSSVAYSPDGKHIISGSFDKSVRVWDALTGQPLKVLKGHTGSVRSVAYSPNGKHIVSGSYDKSVRVWEVSTGYQHKCLEGHIATVTSVACSPDGKYIVSGSYDNLVRVWDASTGHRLKILAGHTDLVYSVACSPDGKHIVSGSYDNSVRVWDVLPGRQLKVLEGHAKAVSSVAYSPDGKHIVSGSYDNSVRLWDAFLGQRSRLSEGATSKVNQVAFSPDGKHVASGSCNSSLQVWDASTGQQLKARKSHTDAVTSLAYSPDGKCIASGLFDNSVRVWDASTRKVLRSLKGHTGTVLSVAYSPDGKEIASGSFDDSIRVWNASTGKQLKVLEGHTGTVYSVAYSTDGKHIASGSFDRSIGIWDVQTCEQLKLLQGHTDIVAAVAYAPDNNQIASGSSDKSVRVWDASTGQQLKLLEGHTSFVSSVAYSPDGKHIVSASNDGSVRVWDTSTGGLLKVLEGHLIQVLSVAYSPDGEHIASGSLDTTVRIWSPFAKVVDVQYLREKIGGVFTGWLVSPTDPSAYLMFVPLSENLPDATNILTVPSSFVAHVDLFKARLGANWTDCYTPDIP